MAYQLAATGEYDAAIGVLDMAIDLNPEVANLYDSKAEMFLLKGDLDAAREWYLEAASMDPEFENPRRMLERIDQMTGVESSAPQAGSEP